MSEVKIIPGPAEKAKPNRKLLENQLQQAEFYRLDYVAFPEPGTTLAEMLKPEYWGHISGAGEESDPGKRIRPWARIEVRSSDRVWWAELRVSATSPFAAKVDFVMGGILGRTIIIAKEFLELEAAIIEAAKAKAPPEPARAPEGYKIEHAGKNGWRVIRLSDNQRLKDGFESQAAAEHWVEAQKRALA